MGRVVELSPKRSAVADKTLSLLVQWIERLRVDTRSPLSFGSIEDVIALMKEADVKNADAIGKGLDELNYQVIQFSGYVAKAQEQLLKQLDAAEDKIRKKFGSLSRYEQSTNRVREVLKGKNTMRTVLDTLKELRALCTESAADFGIEKEDVMVATHSFKSRNNVQISKGDKFQVTSLTGFGKDDLITVTPMNPNKYNETSIILAPDSLVKV